MTSARPAVATVVVLAGAVVVLVGVSAAVHRDESPTDDVCDVADRLNTDVEQALTTAGRSGVSAGEVRATVDAVRTDLAALSNAAPGRFATPISQLEASARDIRQSLVDIGDDTPYAQARPLVDEAVDEAQPVFEQLMAAIEPLCAERR